MDAFKLDTRQFKQAVDFVAQNTRKELPDILNRAALTTIIGGKGVEGAMQRTPKAKAATISALPVEMITRVVMKKLRAGPLPTLPGFAKAGARRQEIRRLVKREYAKRIAAIGYTAKVGWSPAAVAFGGRGVGGRGRRLGAAQAGFGVPATASNLVVRMANAAPAADKIGRQALQEALDNVATDMIEHTKEKLQAIFDKVNAR